MMIAFIQIKGLSTNSEIIGKLENGKYVYHVNISDYKNQLGIYNTHIYAWDKHGNRVNVIHFKSQLKKIINIIIVPL